MAVGVLHNVRGVRKLPLLAPGGSDWHALTVSPRIRRVSAGGHRSTAFRNSIRAEDRLTVIVCLTQSHVCTSPACLKKQKPCPSAALDHGLIRGRRAPGAAALDVKSLTWILNASCLCGGITLSYSGVIAGVFMIFVLFHCSRVATGRPFQALNWRSFPFSARTWRCLESGENRIDSAVPAMVRDHSD